MGEIDSVLDTILSHEGGFQANKNDKGNYNSEGKLVGTNFGISAPVLEAYLGRPVTAQDMKELTEDTAKDIYRRNYIHPVVNNLGVEPSNPAFEQVVDMVVNHGYANTVPIVQRAIGVKVDGKAGPATRKAIEKAKNLNNTLVDKRKNFYNQIVKSDDKQKVFLNGWLKRAESFRDNP